MAAFFDLTFQWACSAFMPRIRSRGLGDLRPPSD
jgi:hypothetical protein